MHHGDADEDDVGQVGEHRRQEHKVAELLAEAGPGFTPMDKSGQSNPKEVSQICRNKRDSRNLFIGDYN